MAQITDDIRRKLIIALAGRDTGATIGNILNGADAYSTQFPFGIAALIVATNVSQTIDFGALAVGDKVIHIATTPGNPDWVTVATKGTLGEAAVVGDLYVAIRAYAAPAALAATL